MSHIPSKEQEKAFKQAVNAIKKCKKLGLVIYAKQYELVAYTKKLINTRVKMTLK